MRSCVEIEHPGSLGVFSCRGPVHRHSRPEILCHGSPRKDPRPSLVACCRIWPIREPASGNKPSLMSSRSSSKQDV